MNIYDLNNSKLSIMKSTASLLNTYGVGQVSMSHDRIFVNDELMIYIEDGLVLSRIERLGITTKQRLAIYSLTKSLQFVISDILKVKEADNESYQENISQWLDELED